MTKLFACKLEEEAVFEQLKPGMLDGVPESSAMKALGFFHSNDSQRHLIGELLARYALHFTTGERYTQPFLTGIKGKPHTKAESGIHFNVSHSARWVVVAIADTDVGVDVERIRRVPEGVAYRFFSEQEKQMLDNATNEIEKVHIFFTLWTLKESYLKAIGSGLTKSLSSFTIQRRPDGGYQLEPNGETEGYYLKAYSFAEGYKLAACAANDEFEREVTFLSVTDLLK